MLGALVANHRRSSISRSRVRPSQQHGVERIESLTAQREAESFVDFEGLLQRQIKIRNRVSSNRVTVAGSGHVGEPCTTDRWRAAVATRIRQVWIEPLRHGGTVRSRKRAKIIETLAEANRRAALCTEVPTQHPAADGIVHRPWCTGKKTSAFSDGHLVDSGHGQHMGSVEL